MRKQADVVILLSDKTDFKLKLIRKDLKGHFILKKGKFNQEGIMIRNTCVSIPDVLNFIKSVCWYYRHRLTIIH